MSGPGEEMGRRVERARADVESLLVDVTALAKLRTAANPGAVERALHALEMVSDQLAGVARECGRIDRGVTVAPSQRGVEPVPVQWGRRS